MMTFFVAGTPQFYLNLLPPVRPILSTSCWLYPLGDSLPFTVRKPTMINIPKKKENSKSSKYFKNSLVFFIFWNIYYIFVF